MPRFAVPGMRNVNPSAYQKTEQSDKTWPPSELGV
jgi:hypothetical protein